MLILSEIENKKTFRIFLLVLYIFFAIYILDFIILIFEKLFFYDNSTKTSSEQNEEEIIKASEHNKIVYQEIDNLLKNNLVSKALDVFCNSLIIIKNDEQYFHVLHEIKQKFFDENIPIDFLYQNQNEANIRRLLSKNPLNIDLLLLDTQYITAFFQYRFSENIKEEDFNMMVELSRFLEKTFSSKEYLKNNFYLPRYVIKNNKNYYKLVKNPALMLFKQSDIFKKKYGETDIEFIPNDLRGLITILKEWLIISVYDFIIFLKEQTDYNIANTYLELYFDKEIYSDVSIADYIALSELNEQFEKLDKEFNYIHTGKLNNNLEFDEDIYEERAYWWGLDGWQFEQQVAKVFEAIGYKTDVTKGSGDGGVDIILTKDSYRAIVQCKHHTDPVGPEAVRALYGVKKDFRADEVIMVASVGVTPSGYEFIKDKSDYKLYTLDDIIKMSKKNSF